MGPLKCFFEQQQPTYPSPKKIKLLSLVTRLTGHPHPLNGTKLPAQTVAVEEMRTAKLTAAAGGPGSRLPRYKYLSVSAVDPEDEEARERRESALVVHLQHPRKQKGNRNWLIMSLSVSGFLLLVFGALL